VKKNYIKYIGESEVNATETFEQEIKELRLRAQATQQASDRIDSCLAATAK
jgi:hypothetical protein